MNYGICFISVKQKHSICLVKRVRVRYFVKISSCFIEAYYKTNLSQGSAKTVTDSAQLKENKLTDTNSKEDKRFLFNTKKLFDWSTEPNLSTIY